MSEYELFHWLDAIICLLIAVTVLLLHRGVLAYLLGVSSLGVAVFTLYGMHGDVELMATLFDLGVLIMLVRMVWDDRMQGTDI